MRKHYKYKLYDTDTAIRIGVWVNGLSADDPNYIKEELFRKRTGEYFLYGEGGLMTLYGKWIGNTGSYGANIRPYTYEEARNWAQAHLDSCAFLAEFKDSNMSENGRVPLSLTVSPLTKSLLEKQRRDTDKSISQLVDELVKKEYAKQSPRSPAYWNTRR